MQARGFFIIGIFILIFIGLMTIGASLFHQIACEGQPINFRLEPTVEQEIWGERIISQSFVAPRNNLNRIDILFQTYERQNTHDVTLTLSEFPADTDSLLQAQAIQEFTFNAADVQDRSWRTFEFAPISDSVKKRYLITLQSPQSVEGDAITVGGIEWDVYEPGSAFLGPVPARADISFRACFQMSVRQKLDALAHQLTQHRPGVWGNIIFYNVSLLIYVILLGGLFWYLAKLALPKP